MRIPRFYIDTPLPDRGDLSLPDSAARHITTVLRLKVGAALTLFNGNGGEYRAELLSSQKRHVQARILEHHAIEREVPWPLCLALCVSKGSKMDLSVQKATELGATQIQPLISTRSVVKLDTERAARRQQHWRDIVISSSEQCARNRLSEIAPVADLATWIQSNSLPGLKLMFTPQADQLLVNIPPPDTTGICLLIGPEGGFSENEITTAKAQGFQGVSFGQRILRAETAAIAGLSAVLALWSQQ
jgi:16S rRNA (uracil1498-N3)-methyltransferase